MRKRAISLWIGIAVAGTMLGRPLAQEPPRQETPVFRSGVDLVTVDATVVGSGGRPIEHLTAEHFHIKVDGTPRRVVRAMFVPHKPAAPRTTRPAPYFSSNEHIEPGRLLMVAVDQQHIRRVEGLAALRAAAEFIDQLDPADRVAAAPLNHIGPVRFTNEHAAVKSYLKTLAGTATSLRGQFTLGLTESLGIADGNRTWLDRVVLRECGEPLGRLENPARTAEREGVRDPCPVQIEQEARALAQEERSNARTSLNQLLGLIARLAEIDGPKTLVLVSEGLVAEPQLIDLTALGAAAQAARVTIYVLQLEQPVFDASETIVSPTLYADLQVRGDGLARLASSARGAHFRLVGADSYPFKRILTELSGYYLLAFEAAPADLDGRIRRIDVSTSAPGSIVRARPAFRNSAVRSPNEGEAKIVRLLRNPRLATELTVRATAHTFREPADGRMRVIVSAEADGGAAPQLTIGYVLIDGAGVIAASGTGEVADGRFTQAVTVAKGRYTLRVGAMDSAGRQGSIERTFEARLNGAGTVAASDLALTDTEPGRPLRPTIAHAPGDRLAAVLEVYGPPGRKLDQLVVEVEVRSEDGTTPPVKAPARVLPVSASTWRARAELNPAALAPGSYVVTARIAVDGSALMVERGFVR